MHYTVVSVTVQSKALLGGILYTCTVEPPNNGPLKSGQTPYSGHI